MMRCCAEGKSGLPMARWPSKALPCGKSSEQRVSQPESNAAKTISASQCETWAWASTCVAS